MPEYFTKKQIIINGKKYESLADVPPEQREQIEKVAAFLKGKGAGRVISFVLKMMLKGKGGQAGELLKTLGLEPDTDVIDVTDHQARHNPKSFSRSSTRINPPTERISASGERINMSNLQNGEENLEGSGFKTFAIFMAIGIAVLWFLYK